MAIRRKREQMTPEAYAERRRQDRERYIRKKKNNEIKTIADYTIPQQKAIREIWRKNSRNYRERKGKTNRKKKLI